MPAIADGRRMAETPSGSVRSTTSAGLQGIAQLRAASSQWDSAYNALMRRDYAEYDRITGFEMPKGTAQ